MPNIKVIFLLALAVGYSWLVLTSHAILFSSNTSSSADGHFNLNCSYFTGVSVIEKIHRFYNTTSRKSVACPRILDFSQS